MSESSALSKWFWNPSIWLPPNVTWQNFEESQNQNIVPEDLAQFSDLWYTLPIALGLIVIRWLVENFLFRPIGIKMGLKDRKVPDENSTLEEIFKNIHSMNNSEKAKVSSQFGLTLRKVRGKIQ